MQFIVSYFSVLFHLFLVHTSCQEKNVWLKIQDNNIYQATVKYIIFVLHVSVPTQSLRDILSNIIHQRHQEKGFASFFKTFGSNNRAYILSVPTLIDLHSSIHHLGTNKLDGNPQSWVSMVHRLWLPIISLRSLQLIK